MTIDLRKFGTTLIARPAGKEAFAAFRPNLPPVAPGESVVVDFTGVLTFSPSWGDEFLTPLANEFGDQLLLRNTRNPSVQATLDILQKATGKVYRQLN